MTVFFVKKKKKKEETMLKRGLLAQITMLLLALQID